MINKNSKYLFVFIFFVCILSISAISATENTTDKEVIKTSNNKESNLETINYQDDDVSNSNENVELKEKENNNEQSKSETDKTTAENEDPLSFSDLNTIINGDGNSTIYLSHNYRYNSATDSAFRSGIQISRDLTVYGNGVTLDGNNMARIFRVTASSLNVIFYNINFINGRGYDDGVIFFLVGGAIDGGGNAYNCNFTGNKADHGGAIAYGNAYNCIFTENKAVLTGGAINGGGNAYNCTFTGNSAGDSGGAMYGGDAIFCTFNGDTTYKTNIIPAMINVINYTSPYKSGEKLKFNLTANGTLYDGFNTTIKIYKGTSLIKTIYALTGEGWIVDLEPGEYTAELSLTDYPDEKSSNATINVLKGTSITAKPVTTTYNVDKYLTITLKDQNGKAIKNAVLTVNIGGAKKHKNTDKNGQIKINVATLTPKTYNAKITYAGSNNYNASTSSVKVTVKKATPKITAKSTSYKLKVKTKKYPVIIKNNKNKALKNTKVTLKVNGKTFNVKTNSKGLGVFKITNLKKKGIYIAVITVPTNKYYNKISKKMKIAVKS